MDNKIVCAAAAAAVALSALAGCGKRASDIADIKKKTTTERPAVAAMAELDSLSDSAKSTQKTDSSSASSENQSAKKDDGKKSEKENKDKKTESAAETTAVPEEPIEPDIRGAQPYLGAADGDDFSDACFIGASQTVGLSFFGNKVEPDFFAYAGLNVDSVFENAFINPDGSVAAVSDDGTDPEGLITTMEALELKHYSRIYLAFGLNELGGWIDYQHFYDSYVKLIGEIKRLQPDAVIYVQSVLPVSRYALETNAKYTNENIDAFNTQYIKSVANATGSSYVNVNALLRCTNGYLARDASSDGIHLSASYCLEWMDILAYYAPSGGMIPGREIPDFVPQPKDNGGGTTATDDSRSDGALPPEIIPQKLPDVIIPDAPAPEVPADNSSLPDTENGEGNGATDQIYY